MTAFAKIQAAAESIGVYATPRVYTKNDRDIWITYNLTYEMGELYGDDVANDLRTGVQVHLFFKLSADRDVNFFPLSRRLRKALIAQGFTHPQMMYNTIEDNKVRHIVFECEDDEESED